MSKNRLDRVLAGFFVTSGIIVIGAAPPTAQASDISLNGFASIGAGKVLDAGDIFPDIDSTGARSFYDSETSFNPDSLYAFQILADLGDGLSVTAQVVAKGSRNFDPDLEWGYITYEPSDRWSFSAGKRRVPYYYYSDFLDVGYAYHWIRPPTTIYSIPTTTYSGVQGTYSIPVGNWDLAVTYYIGDDNAGAPASEVEGALEDLKLDIDEQQGLVANLTRDWFQIRLLYQKNQFTVSAFIPPQGQRILINNVSSDTYNLGLALTPGNWTIGAEYADFSYDDNALNTQKNWYATLGYRIGAFMPHATYATLETGDEVNEEADQEVSTLGVRWDFHPSAALKIEYSESETTAPAGGVDADAELIAVAIDVVF